MGREPLLRFWEAYPHLLGVTYSLGSQVGGNPDLNGVPSKGRIVESQQLAKREEC